MGAVAGQLLNDIGSLRQAGGGKAAVGRGAERSNHGAARAGGVAGEIADLENRALNGDIGMLAVVLPYADGGQGLVAETEGVALSGGDKRLLCVRVCLGKALQRLQLLHPEPAVPQAQVAHFRAVQLNAAILVRVEHAQVVKFPGGCVVAGVPDLEGHMGQPLIGNSVFLDNFNHGPFVVLEIGRMIPVGVEGDKLGGRVLQPGRRNGFFRNFVYARQQILQHGESCAVRFDLVHRMAVRRPDSEHCVLNRRSVVCVIFIDIEVGPLVVLQHDSAFLSGEQLHMMFFQVQNVVVQSGGFHQGINAGV